MTLEQMERAKRANQDAIDRIIDATRNRVPNAKEMAAIQHHQLAIAKLTLMIYRSN